MTEPIIIGVGTIKFVKEATTFMKTLTNPTPFTGALTLHDENGVNYIVPAGKKFIILKITGGQGNTTFNALNSTDSTNRTMTIWKNNIIDSTAGGTQLYYQNAQFNGFSWNPQTAIAIDGIYVNADVYYTIAAGFNVVSDCNTTIGVQVLGVECNV